MSKSQIIELEAQVEYEKKLLNNCEKELTAEKERVKVLESASVGLFHFIQDSYSMGFAISKARLEKAKALTNDSNTGGDSNGIQNL